MTTKKNTGKKNNFSFFIFHFLLLMLLSTLGQADFTRNNETKIVTDNETDLQWQDNESATRTWKNAIKYCEDLTLGNYDDWRLPNINELLSIVDDTKVNPSISSAFESFTSSNYWSSTTAIGTHYKAWVVYFGGQSYSWNDSDNKRGGNRVQCVRTGRN